MKRIITILMLAVCTITLSAQDNKADKQWLKQGLWRNGFNGAKPHKSLNATEFHTQYTKNRQQWETLFQWLRDTDLQAIPKGKHPIPNSTLTASVEDSQNLPLAKRNTESHKKKIDFQLVVRGTEGFALLDHASSTVSVPYDEKKDVDNPLHGRLVDEANAAADRPNRHKGEEHADLRRNSSQILHSAYYTILI